ncbi:hypothetical protein [Kingella negevensis]|uniref:hypothetical protein n=1 Tax=Kingella negevensis TaxID=1522312 RepID=UPI00050A18B5|nr:hypothetical protein [Kingella negevensis]MDK4688303.1 hypothetical protein [Kingella negevensis]WII91924.1 hypothetical protein QEO93_04915 [Kingella negevensis]
MTTLAAKNHYAVGIFHFKTKRQIMVANVYEPLMIHTLQLSDAGSLSDIKILQGMIKNHEIEFRLVSRDKQPTNMADWQIIKTHEQIPSAIVKKWATHAAWVNTRLAITPNDADDLKQKTIQGAAGNRETIVLNLNQDGQKKWQQQYDLPAQNLLVLLNKNNELITPIDDIYTMYADKEELVIKALYGNDSIDEFLQQLKK